MGVTHLHSEAGEVELALRRFGGHVEKLSHFGLGGNLVEEVDNLGILGVSPARVELRV